MRSQSLIAVAAMLAAALSPALMLSVKGGQGYCFFVVLLCALLASTRSGAWRRARATWGSQPLYVAGLLLMPLLILFEIAVLHQGQYPSLDPFVRFALAVPCFALLASLDSGRLRVVQWGFVAGAWGAGLWAVYAHFHPTAWTMPGRLGNSFTNPIPFGDTALLFGFLSVISISRGSRIPVAETLIKLAALLLGGYASYLSGSRGGWVAVPILLWATFSGRHWLASRRAKLAVAAVLMAGAAGLASMHVMRDRVDAGLSDFSQLEHGNHDTSIGLRLDLWRAATLIYERHPLFGVGRGALHDALAELADHGEAPRVIVNAGGHSEIFSTLSQTGTLGILALLLFYAGLIVPFWRERRNADPEIATAAYLGLSLGGSTVVFGLTIDFLTSVMNAGLVGLTSATLLAWIMARRREHGAEVPGAVVHFARPPRRILVASPRRLGDVLLTTPLVRSLKRQWPEAQIDMVVFRGTESVLEGNPDLHRVIVVAPRAGIRERIADALRLWRRYDLACAAVDSDRALFYTWFAGRKRVGVVNADRVKWMSRTMLHAMALDRHLSMHTVTSSLALAPLVGAAPLAEVVAPGIGTDPQRRASFEAHFAALPGALTAGRLVVLHLAPMFRYKQWTEAGWVELIRWLRAQGFVIALSGGPAAHERAYAESIAAAAGGPLLNLVGQLSFGETAEMIRHARLYVGPDTGATHVAAACGTPVIALFGPTDPVRWAPWPSNWRAFDEPWPRRGSGQRSNVYLLQGEGDCVPCRGEGCDGHQQSDSACLTGMPAQRVMAAAAHCLGLAPEPKVVTMPVPHPAARDGLRDGL